MSIIRSALLPGSLVMWLVLVGVHDARHISYYDDNTVLQPIVTRSMKRRICTELCMSGLGGTPCGDDCVDLAPQGLPLQSVPSSAGLGASGVKLVRNDTVEYKGQPRTSACPILCKYQLGYPLCTCDDLDNVAKSSAHFEEPRLNENNSGEWTYPKRVDFLEICGFFCLEYNYQLYGCQDCEMFKELNVTNRDTTGWTISGKIIQENWELWCSKKCVAGDGGAACHCDLLPMAMAN